MGCGESALTRYGLRVCGNSPRGLRWTALQLGFQRDSAEPLVLVDRSGVRLRLDVRDERTSADPHIRAKWAGVRAPSIANGSKEMPGGFAMLWSGFALDTSTGRVEGRALAEAARQPKQEKYEHQEARWRPSCVTPARVSPGPAAQSQHDQQDEDDQHQRSTFFSYRNDFMMPLDKMMASLRPSNRRSWCATRGF